MELIVPIFDLMLAKTLVVKHVLVIDKPFDPLGPNVALRIARLWSNATRSPL